MGVQAATADRELMGGGSKLAGWRGIKRAVLFRLVRAGHSAAGAMPAAAGQALRALRINSVKEPGPGEVIPADDARVSRG